MKFLTKILAIDPFNGKLCEWVGPEIEANDFVSAEIYCKECMGYCEVVGQNIIDDGQLLNILNFN